MALIKLSALVSDIKGKLQGTVFSGGTSGVSMRNQPSGGGRKSPLWSHQKALFSQVTAFWRSLTDEEKAAWASAAPLFPKTNKFGAPRLPSGYEVFVSVNTTLLAAGESVLLQPQAPRSLPVLDSIQFFTPSNQNLLVGSIPSIISKAGTFCVPVSPDFFDSSNLVLYNAFACDYYLARGAGTSIPFGELIPLFSSVLSNGVEFGLFLITNSNNTHSFQWRITWEQGEGVFVNAIRVYDVPRALPTLGLSVVFHFSLEDPRYCFLSVNNTGLSGTRLDWFSGINQFFSAIPFGSPSVAAEVPDCSSVSGRLCLGAYDNSVRSYYSPSKLRYFDSTAAQFLNTPSGSPVLAQLFQPITVADGLSLLQPIGVYNSAFAGYSTDYFSQLLHSGYLLEFETTVVSFDTVSDSGFRSVVGDKVFYLSSSPDGNCCDDGCPSGGSNESECKDCVCVIKGTNIINELFPHSGAAPLIWSTGLDTEDLNFSLAIQSSGSISRGISGENSKRKRLGLYSVDGKFMQLQTSLLSTFGAIAGNSDITIECALIDLETGVSHKAAVTTVVNEVIDIATSRPRRKSRFKAGTELSGKVN